MKHTLKEPIVSYVVGLCKAKEAETLRVIVLVSMADQDHQLRISLKPGFCACKKRHILSEQEGTILPSEGRAEGRVPPQGELPGARNILGLEQGEGQASKGPLFNSANAMVIFAGAINKCYLL